MKVFSSVSGIDTHAHVFHRRLTMTPVRRYTPACDALPVDYLARLDAAGFSHGVLVQPSFLGFDNRYLIHTLRQYPGRLRGIVMVGAGVAEAALDAFDSVGVVGIRLNLVGQMLADYRSPVWRACLARVARRGWRIEVQCAMLGLAEILPVLLDSGATVVVDHFGLPEGGLRPSLPAHRAFLRCLERAPVWVKLSAAYRSELDPVRTRHALQCLRQACGGDARFVWGSDWPHTQFAAVTDYTDQWRQFQALLPEAGMRRRILIDNPCRLFGFDTA